MAKLVKRDEVPSVVHLARVQLLRGVERGHELALDAAEAASRAAASLPIKDLPTASKIPGVPSLDAATRFTFDLAAELLSSQRDFAMRLTRALRSK